MPVTTPAAPTARPAAPTTEPELSLTRLHMMRAGYLLMGIGLAVVKWPLFSQAHTCRSTRV
jgi:hypothetical protein